ncbi:DUF3099 domain-containing protein [Streptomyces hesseae]|uniref:DUF3099 domain-containing protein n=1 Tax=Streptomyces hesseae TaxID=3075519 RepID=A0ABU2SUC5_9ACTN|nr:DUF3099 domain-containing protein [Streptomyces sp. DSM 40473]MDT0452343.1 DUF3099 domain-containing protein [Streptomyces sp. DSM 40473]
MGGAALRAPLAPFAQSAPRSYRESVYARRKHLYFAMMGTCIFLFVMAWAVVRLWSVPAAVGLCLFAMVIPPVAAIVANRRGPEDRWWDDPSGDEKSDEWWDELDGKRRQGPRDPWGRD